MSKTNFELQGIEHDLIDRYSPVFLGKGGENLVYEVPGRGVVIKARVEPIRKILLYNFSQNLPLDTFPSEIHERSADYLRKEAARYNQLKKYFGPEHVIIQREYVMKIPMTEDILRFIFDGNPPGKVSEVFTIVTVQKRLKAIEDPNRLGIMSGYAENNNVPSEIYQQITSHLIFGKNLDEKLEREHLLQIQSSESLRILLESIDSDGLLRECLQELITKVITFTTETGEILDFAGEDNIVIYKNENGKWNYSLVDCRYPRTKMVEETKTILTKLSRGEKIEKGEKNTLKNVFNFVRTVNGLAEQLGIHKRINIIPENISVDNLDFLEIIRY